jgi:chitosanase
MLTSTQKKTAEAIVNIFETSEVLGDYSMVTLIEGDTGHLTFGRSQTTLGSGNLHKILKRYCDNSGARFGPRLAPYLPRFATIDLTLDHDHMLHNILRASADDPIMRDTQDTFFNEAYWKRAVRAARGIGIRSALGVAVVYDSYVHGSWAAMRKRTVDKVGDPAQAGEKAWISAYVATRRGWLAGHSRPDLRATVYRMDSFQRLIDQDYWGLELPLVVRGKEISTAALSATPPGCYEGPQPGTRILALQSPMQRGLDVRLVQLGLSISGAIDIKADGIFGQTSARRLRAYQKTNHLPPTGTADAALIAKLVA